MALLLRKRGIERVRPLLGGFDAWREHGLPIESEDGERSTPVAREAPVDDVPAELGAVGLLDEAGEAVRLSDAWRDRPAVLVFVRHFGCILCRDFVTRLRDRADEIRAAGADLVVVGLGEPEAARRYRALFELDFPVWVDPHRRSYESLGFRRSFGGTANPKVLLLALWAWLRGSRQGAVQGDPWQLGGVLIVTPDGEVRYCYASRYAGDHPKIEALIQVVRRIA